MYHSSHSPLIAESLKDSFVKNHLKHIACDFITMLWLIAKDSHQPREGTCWIYLYTKLLCALSISTANFRWLLSSQPLTIEPISSLHFAN
jgi:hypothetical protein